MGKIQTPEFKQLKKYCTDKRSIKLANELWNKGVPLKKGNPAEKYIVGTRKIPLDIAEQLQIKYLKGPIGISEFDKNKPYKDYVVIPVYNIDDELIGLQIIQIDNDGNKAINPTISQFYCKKYVGPSKPWGEGKAAVINKTDDVNVVFIAEGVETAASVASLGEVRNHYTVLASMGVSELPSTLAYVKTHYPPGATVVLLKDHDISGSKADLDFKQACILFQDAGYHVIVKEPPVLGEDWNDVMVSGGVEQLSEQFNLHAPILFLSDAPEINSTIAGYFKGIYTDLLKAEKLAEEKANFCLLDTIIEQLITQLQETQESDDFQKSFKALNEVVSAIDLVRTALSNSTSSLPKIPCQFRKLKKATAQLKHLEDLRRDDLRNDEEIDFSTDPQSNSNGDLFKAYSYAMHRCYGHLETLNPSDVQNFKKNSRNLKFYEQRLTAINLEISRIPKLITEFSSDDKLIVKQLQDRLASLRIERKLLTQEIYAIKQQLRLIRSGPHKSKTPYSNYYGLFVEEANSILMKGEVTPSVIRKKMSKRCSIRNQELQEQYQKQIEIAKQIFVAERKRAIPPIIRYLMQLKQIIQVKSQQIEGQSLLPEYRDYQKRYLLAMEALGKFEGMDKILQCWLNNLKHFKVILPLIYYGPEEEEALGEVELIDYDSDGENTLDELYEEIFNSKEDLDNLTHIDQEKGKERQNGTEHDLDSQMGISTEFLSDSHAVSDTAASLVRLLQPLDIKDRKLYLSIQDFAERLAVSLYKSFEVISTDGKVRQEFDGLALRKKQLTIIERKTNDGTGFGLLQRNFCQQKIVSKQDFILKGIITDVVAQPSPHQFILINIPERLDWYSDDFTSTMQDRLVTAAQLKAVEALRKNIAFEFTINKPKSFLPSDYHGLFFNRNLIDSVSLRLSKVGKGDEDEAHHQMERVSKQRTGVRESSVRSLTST